MLDLAVHVAVHAVMVSMDMHLTLVDGVATRWLEQGEGPPVVLVHGIPTSPRLWRYVLPRVRGRSLAWEMRGYGKSVAEGTAADLSLSAQADYLLRWLDAVGVQEPAVLVGHDLGGGVAQIAAVRSPERFAGLLLTNAVCYDSWPIPSVKVMQRLAPALRHLPDAAVRPILAQLFRRGHDDAEMAREATAIHWTAYAGHGAARTLIRQVRQLDVADTQQVADRLPSLELPARVVWGESDQFQKVRYGERLASDLRTELIRIPGGRHFTPEDHPELLAETINDLLPGR